MLLDFRLGCKITPPPPPFLPLLRYSFVTVLKTLRWVDPLTTKGWVIHNKCWRKGENKCSWKINNMAALAVPLLLLHFVVEQPPHDVWRERGWESAIKSHLHCSTVGRLIDCVLGVESVCFHSGTLLRATRGKKCDEPWGWRDWNYNHLLVHR